MTEQRRSSVHDKLLGAGYTHSVSGRIGDGGPDDLVHVYKHSDPANVESLKDVFPGHEHYVYGGKHNLYRKVDNPSRRGLKGSSVEISTNSEGHVLRHVEPYKSVK